MTFLTFNGEVNEIGGNKMTLKILKLFQNERFMLIY